MVRHIVFYNFKEGVNKEEAIRVIDGALTPLVGKIPGLRHLEVRLTFEGMDYALYSEFDSAEALKNYATQPLHEAAKGQFTHFIGTRVCADYEV